jgi:hypothetical protein
LGHLWGGSLLYVEQKEIQVRFTGESKSGVIRQFDRPPVCRGKGCGHASIKA